MNDFEKYSYKNTNSLGATSFTIQCIIFGVFFMGVYLFLLEPTDSFITQIIKIVLSFIGMLIFMKFIIYLLDYIANVPRKKFLKSLLPINNPVPSEITNFLIGELEEKIKVGESFKESSSGNPYNRKKYEHFIKAYQMILASVKKKNPSENDLNVINAFILSMVAKRK